MNYLYQEKYLLNFNAEDYTRNNYQYSLMAKEKLSPKDNYGIVYDFEIEAIMNYETKQRSVNYSVLLLLLSYIRAYTWKSTDKSKPEIFHSQYMTIGKYIGVNKRTVSKGISALEELGIIKTYRMTPSVRSDGRWSVGDVVFAFPYKIITKNNHIHICTKEEYDCDKELELGISYLRDKQKNYKSKRE